MKRTAPAFIGFLAVAIIVIGGVSAFTLHVFGSYVYLKHLWILFAFLPLILLVSMTIGNKYYNRANAIIYTVSVLWISMLLYLFTGALIVGILSLMPLGFGVLHMLAVVALYIIVLLFIFGIWKALNPIIKTYKLKAPLLQEKWGDKKIVLFSDSHLGMVRHGKWMEKIVGMVNDLKPDIVFIAGDLIDGPVFPYETGLAPLANIKSTYGVFYTAGNHDEYNVEQAKYYAALNKHITVLNDKKVTVNGTQIIGVMYAHESVGETQERLLSTDYDKNIPSIVMLHDPKNVQALADLNVTLSLSGHTHGGQFFPFTLVVRSVYKNLTKGIHYIGNMAHLTSVGVGTAGPIMRLGTTPEIAIIKIL